MATKTTSRIKALGAWGGPRYMMGRIHIQGGDKGPGASLSERKGERDRDRPLLSVFPCSLVTVESLRVRCQIAYASCGSGSAKNRPCGLPLPNGVAEVGVLISNVTLDGDIGII